MNARLSGAALFVTALLLVGCFVHVTDVSRKEPYRQFAGKTVVAKVNGEVWTNTQKSYQIRDNFVRLDSFGPIESYRTELKKIAAFPIGTRMHIESIKHKKVESEMMGYEGTLALCTVFLPDGRKIKCQMPWEV